MKHNASFLLNVVLLVILLAACGVQATSVPGVSETPIVDVVNSIALAAYFPFSGNANDASGNGNNGIVHGATLTTDRFGNANSAYYFDGSSTIEIPDSDTLTLDGDFSIGLWVNVPNPNQTSAMLIINKHMAYQNDDGSWGFFVQPPGNQLVFSATQSVDWRSVYALDSFSFNDWHCAFFTYHDGTDNWDFYLDGLPAGNGEYDFNIQDTDMSLYLGAEQLNGGFQNFFSGQMDELYFFQRALSLEEVKTVCATPGMTMPQQTPVNTPGTIVSPLDYFEAMNHDWRTAWFELYFPYPVSRLCASNGIGLGDYCIPISREGVADISPSDFQASWAPDGSQLAIAGGLKLIIWTPGGELETILESDTVQYNHPAWSPDGRFIAFEVDRDIYIRSLDGQIYQKMSLNAANEHPDWSPDSQKLIFSSAPDDSNWEIEMIELDDADHPVYLTQDVEHQMSSMYPHWSPDGNRIAFLSNRLASSPGPSFELFIMNADGSNVYQVTQQADFPVSVYAFYWLPDGRSILINDWLVELETGAITVIIPDPLPGRVGYTYFFPTVWLMSQPSVSVLPLPAPPCGHRWSQLVPEMDAIVTAGDLPNRVRLEPSTTSDVIQQIYPHTVVHVLEGPVCSDGLVFWKVENESIPGGSGWTAEGDGTEYWLAPYEP